MARTTRGILGACMLALLAILPSVAEEILEDGDELVEKTSNGIRFLSGGIGSDERAELLERASRYSLMLMFRQRGSSVALTDVSIVIRAPKGEPVLEALSDGPFFLANLPRGKYVVEASLDGHTQRKTIVISRQQRTDQRLIFRWNRPASN